MSIQDWNRTEKNWFWNRNQTELINQSKGPILWYKLIYFKNYITSSIYRNLIVIA